MQPDGVNHTTLGCKDKKIRKSKFVAKTRYSFFSHPSVSLISYKCRFIEFLFVYILLHQLGVGEVSEIDKMNTVANIKRNPLNYTQLLGKLILLF